MYKEDKNNEGTGLEIAVIGMAGCFPGANHIERFWDNLKNGVESIAFFSDEELEASGIDMEVLQNPNYVKAKGLLEDIEYFDYTFFDYSLREAGWMDPQFRILHECCWHALENAGYDPDVYTGAIGLFVGTLANYHWVSGLFDRIGNPSEQTVIGSLNDRDFFSTRVAYKLNLRGPALTVQTACSTSLVAIHMGCQSLLSGESDMVLAGGASVWLPKKSGYHYETGMIRSEDGRSRAFDARANGTNGGDAAAIVVLKRLEDALADNDRIDAMIKGSAINNDGRRKVGYTAPSVEGQVEVIRAALQMAEVEPESVTMIEAHGTATALGDPVEIEALKRAFNTDKRQFCAIGSVKTNVGHLDAAAGAAGFIKTVLSLKYRLIPPGLHYETPNPRIDFDNSPFYVNTGPREWTGNGNVLRAGVSSFGLGGTNAHVVLEEAPQETRQKTVSSRKHHLLVLSARTPPALDKMIENLADYFKTNPEISLADTTYTLQVGRKAFEQRFTAAVSTCEEAVTALSDPDVNRRHTMLPPSGRQPVIFMFSGQGSQYVNMGLDLYRQEPGFARDMDRCFEILQSIMGEDIFPVLYPHRSPTPTGVDPEKIHEFTYTSPIKFVFDYCLARLLMSWGIQPYAMIGHSFGEYVAACLSGVFSLEDALKLVAARGRLMHLMPEGAMMNVPLSETELQPYLHRELALAAVNEPGLCIVSGSPAAVEALETELSKKGHECLRLRVPRASHSPMMIPMLAEFKKILETVTWHDPQIPYISGLSGTWISVEEATGPGYYARHLQQTIRFSGGLEELFKEAGAVFLEVGSGRGLSLFVSRHPAKQPDHQAINLVRHRKEDIPDTQFLLEKIGWLWRLGVLIDWPALQGNDRAHRVSLPLYPFDRHYFSVDISSHAGKHRPQQKQAAFAVPSREMILEKEDDNEFQDSLEGKIATVIREVLGLQQVPADKDFFQLGGDSLTAVMASTKISKTFRVEFPVTVILSGASVKEIGEQIKKMEGHVYEDIPPVEKKEYYPLSSAQKRLFFLDRLEGIGTTYHMSYILKLEGNVDIPRIEAIFRQLPQRHEILGTSFRYVGDRPVQYICDEAAIAIESLPAGDAYPLFIRPFDLARPPLLRVGMAAPAAGEFLLLFDMHHIISDGTSMAVLVKEFTSLYEEKQLPHMKIQYKDFSQWQNRLFESGRIKEHEAYWLELLKDDIPLLNLPLDFPRPKVLTFEGKAITFKLESDACAQFKRLNAVHSATLFMGLLAVFNILLNKYAGQEDIIVGSATAGRSHDDLKNLLGLFVNMLPMRNYPRGEKTFARFLEEVKDNCLLAFKHQDMQLEELTRQLDPERDPGRNPLFDVSFSLQNFEQPPIKASGVTFSQHQVETRTSKFDLTLLAWEIQEEILFRLEYCTHLFKQETVTRMTRHFITIIRQVMAEPGISIRDIDMLTEEERQQVLYDFNRTTADFPADKPVHYLFLEQVRQTPDRIALVGPPVPGYEGESAAITYKELDSKSDQLAHYLLAETGLCQGEPVVILMSQWLYRPVSIFGVLKAGGAYVPVDASTPQERIKYIIKDAGIRTILSEKQYLNLLNRLQWECDGFNRYICLDSDDIHGEEETERNQLMEEELWRHVGETARDEITGGGWISSYTGEPISKQEMDEYGDNILKKLTPLLNRDMRILEIGCASGISMFRLAPEVGLYYGTDLSQAIIETNKKRVKEEGHQNIMLSCLPAHEIHKLEQRNFDLIIINSVIQCFHGHNYLRNVIKKAVDLLADSGYVFIGDIMDQELKEALIRDLTVFKEKHQGKHYKTKTDFARELFVGRGFFQDLCIELPGVCDVQFSGKIYTIENELTGFRYDALFTVDKGKNKINKVLEKHKYQQDLSTLAAYRRQRPLAEAGPGDLVYVIYTSGTTGVPKGVMIRHGSLVNLCTWHNRYYRVTEQDKATQYAGIGFDASVWEIFPYLLAGAALYLVSDSIKLDIPALKDYYNRSCITIGFLPTQVCEGFLRDEDEIGKPVLRALLTGGDKLTAVMEKPYGIFNNYGPTENTVVTSACMITAGQAVIPIGKPIANNQVYILDKNTLHVQPMGVPGELCISGDSLALGYLNLPELTVERFIRSGSQRLYRSGDLARWLTQGEVEFLGRIDHQVKIRGYRIELEEIQAQLLRNAEVSEAVVTMGKDEAADPYICAYVVLKAPAADEKTVISDLQEYLAGKLPSYMAPRYLLAVETIPLTARGKLDRSALPDPVFRQRSEGFVPPGSAIEKQLVEVWQEILGVKPVGIRDNFFEIGGDSIKAIQVCARLRHYGVHLKINDLFLHPRIEDLGKWANQILRSIHQGMVSGEVPLTPIQQWFFTNNSSETHHFNQSVMLYRASGFDEQIIRQVFTNIAEHHDALRMVYEVYETTGSPPSTDGNTPAIIQRNRDTAGELFDLEVFRFENRAGIGIETEIEKQANRIQAGIDLGRGPLLKLGLFKTPDGDHLLIVIHHLVVDGVSWRIILEDFAAGYRQAAAGQEVRFQEKTDSFKYWSERLRELAAGGDGYSSKTLFQQLAYWKQVGKQAGQEGTLLESLSGNNEIGEEKKKYAFIETVNMSLDHETTELLLKKVNYAYNTEINDILLTALGLAVKECTGKDKVLINLEGHGREPVIENIDIGRTVGWFTAQYPVLLEMTDANDTNDPGDTIRSVKEMLRQIPEKGMGYGILKYLAPEENKQDAAGVFTLVPEINFNYLGQFDTSDRSDVLNGAAKNQEEKVFTYSNLGTGTAISPHMEKQCSLDINGILVQGRLSFSFGYNKFAYKKSGIKTLVENYRKYLLSIIDHCTNREEKKFSPADFHYIGMEISDFDDLEEEVSDID